VATLAHKFHRLARLWYIRRQLPFANQAGVLTLLHSGIGCIQCQEFHQEHPIRPNCVQKLFTREKRREKSEKRKEKREKRKEKRERNRERNREKKRKKRNKRTIISEGHTVCFCGVNFFFTLHELWSHIFYSHANQRHIRMSQTDRQKGMHTWGAHFRLCSSSAGRYIEICKLDCFVVFPIWVSIHQNICTLRSRKLGRVLNERGNLNVSMVDFVLMEISQPSSHLPRIICELFSAEGFPLALMYEFPEGALSAIFQKDKEFRPFLFISFFKNVCKQSIHTTTTKNIPYTSDDILM